MKLILVRHGEVEANVKNLVLGTDESKLTLKGIEQIKKLGKELKEKYKIDMVFCSPINRCVKTLEGILTEYPIDGPIFMSQLIKERELGEYSELGAEMVSWKEINEENKINREMGVENISDFRKRTNLFLEDLKLEDNDLTVLIVTHAGPIRMINDILTGEKFEDGKEFDNCSITEFDYDTEIE
ncbi:MAG: phosphoglycerate mutase family protein [Candidatus Shapirobacteria bacterium]|nr:phosphoglycerate mutase family protein [Candidatus Shapirobacteria bacterium]